MRAVLLSIVACSAPAKQPVPPAPEPPKRDLAVAEPPPKPPSPSPSPKPWLRRIDEPRRFDIADTDLWSPCVRDYWQAQQEPARHALRAALSRYTASCDSNGRVTVTAPEYGKPSVTFLGPLSDLSIAFTSCTSDTVALVIDGKRAWSATGDRRDGCTVTVPDGRAIRRALRDAIDARDAMVGDDFAITDDNRADLRLMLDALDALATQ